MPAADTSPPFPTVVHALNLRFVTKCPPPCTPMLVFPVCCAQRSRGGALPARTTSYQRPDRWSPKRLLETPATDRRRGNGRALQRETQPGRRRQLASGEVSRGLARAAASELAFLTALDRRPPQGHLRASDTCPGVMGSCESLRCKTLFLPV